MARETTEPWVQLATRIPKSLHRQLKLHCVHADTSVMEFVVAAVKEKLARQGRGERRRRDEGTS
jgi:predicted HicB family RNase H-like nuclease